MTNRRREFFYFYVEWFSLFSSGSSYTDNLQPFDRSIGNSMSLQKTDSADTQAAKVCVIFIDRALFIWLLFKTKQKLSQKPLRRQENL